MHLWRLAAAVALLLAPLGAVDHAPTNHLAGIGFRLLHIRSGTLQLPQTWFQTQSCGEHTRLILAASSDPDAVRGLVRRPSGGCSWTSIRSRRLGPEDAFVQVIGQYLAFLPRKTPPSLLLPLKPADFRPGERIHGVPARGFFAQGRDGPYGIGYWIGPEASKMRRLETLTIVRTLRLPGWRHAPHPRRGGKFTPA